VLSTLLNLFITRREVDNKQKETDRRLDELKADIKSDRDSATTSRARLYERIERVNNDNTSALLAFQKVMADKLENIPYRLSALLANTGKVSGSTTHIHHERGEHHDP
jgi:hypothetical protein